MKRRHLRLSLITLLALVLIMLSVWQLLRPFQAVSIEYFSVGQTPITLFAPEPAPQQAPVVIIAHGFAGSQQLMQPFALTLARNGYQALSFDFPGHGRHPVPIAGELADYEARSQMLVAALTEVVDFAQALPGGNGELALVGHSMASDTVMRYASEYPAKINATVAVSPFSDHSRHDAPRNLLVVYGALEPQGLQDLGAAAVAHATPDGQVQAGITYGDFTEGTARRLALANGVEHIGVLYSPVALQETLDWLNQSLTITPGDGFIDRRGPWLLLLLMGLLLLARPLATLLPKIARTPLGSGVDRWRVFWPLALLPAIFTPLILWPLPSVPLPILIGDYLFLHFALYGALTWLGLLWAGKLRQGVWFSRRRLVGAMLAAGAYVTLSVAWVMDTFVASFMPIPERLWLVIVLFGGTFLFFAADEWFTRGAVTLRGAYALTKVLFVLSLIAATLLSLEELFFLIIIIPAMVPFFIVHGLFSRWAYRRSYHPLVGAFANALAFAWAIALTFPLVAR
ncbi:alpha/beta hydrolase [Thiorhodospira sibirica]|uniref:alpha/beta hydrolase n=1 Tax=Thiorhodospira sibirica TaxID=154347 RepID=UPI00022C04CC|nr:alpha/beta fold hydrolase [Thiorhodospira sibirica]